jgi:hypothetical protein
MLRIDRGATLLQGEPSMLLKDGVDWLLGEVRPRLAPAPPALRAASVRARVRLEIHPEGTGYRARVRYFGTAPEGARHTALQAAAGPGSCLLPPRHKSGEVTLEAMLQPPPGDVPVVHVLAGRRPVALPLACMERALSEDAPPGQPLRILSLAHCLAEEPVPADGRPALLLLRGTADAVALRVELLVGHGSERVLPVGALLCRLPWLLGVLARADEAPVLVVDPVPLIRGTEEHDGG